jgi:uncharacterized protein (TIGR00255 family)
MIASMTGFGRAVLKRDDIEVTIEVRSVNNRFLDISLRTPRLLANYEQKIKDLIGRVLSRGRVSLTITIANGNETVNNLTLNRPLAQAYLRLTEDLKQELNLSGNISIEQLLQLPDIINADVPPEENEKYWHVTESGLNEALASLQEMRQQEGGELRKDFGSRITNLEQLLTRIEGMAANRPQAELEKLRQRVKILLKDDKVDESRLEMELAFLADRLDITEECVRFHSHNKAFIQMLDNEQAPGRKLNFLLQEMNREVNTIGSKASSAEISHLVVEIKDEVEKLREQVQNIE